MGSHFFMLPNIAASSQYPITEPTSALNFTELVTEVAYKINVAYYGSTGTGAIQAPIDAHDLSLCQNIVNKAIRMFISDGPKPNGWKWLRPVAQMDLWPQIDADATLGAVSWITSTSYDSTNNLTTLHLNYASTVNQAIIGTTSTNAAPVFLPSMELRQIWLGGNPPLTTPGWFVAPFTVTSSTTGSSFTIVNFLDPFDVQVFGDARSTVGASTVWSMATTGDYTLPANFGGAFVGDITYVANTNRGMTIQWTDESMIRMRRQNYNQETGTPYNAAVRQMPTPSIDFGTYYPMRRRWELMTWRISNEWLHVIFPYILSFNNLVGSTDVPPCPFLFDEALKAACFAVAEKEVEDTLTGPDWTYYRSIALPNAWLIDAQAAPKKLGYCSNPTSRADSWSQVISNFRDADYQRPDVSVGSPIT